MDTIWMYWENRDAKGQMPRYLQLCVESIRRHRGRLNIELLDQQTVRSHLPGLREEVWTLPRIAHRADYLRTRLLHRYGGLWIDCDMAALGSLERLCEIPSHLDYACQSIETSIGCFAARAGCRLLEQVISAQDRVLAERGVDFQWNDIGNELLAKLGRGYAFHAWPRWTVDQIAEGKVSKLMSYTATVEDNVDANALLFHFCNEHAGPLFRRYLRDDRLLTSHTLASKILRRAFDLDEPRGRAIPALEALKDRSWRETLRLRRTAPWRSPAR